MRLSKKQGEILRQAQDDSLAATIYSSMKGFFDTLKLEVGKFEQDQFVTAVSM